jgi:hypothetical protein
MSTGPILLVEVRVHPHTAPYPRRAPICVVVVVIISVFINSAETVPCIIGKGKNLDNCVLSGEAVVVDRL